MESLKPVTTRLPLPILKRLKKAAQDSGLKLEAVMKQAAELWLKENNA
jgi:hypothetical protein